MSLSVTKHSLTIVTAFMSQINTRNDRPVQKYIDLGKSLLRLNVRQIVFIERAIYNAHFDKAYKAYKAYGPTDNDNASTPIVQGHFDYEGASFTYVVHGHITFVFFERSDMYLPAYRDLATEFSLHTPHPKKDTLDYMFVQCTKTEWVAMAIALDQSLSSQFCDGMYAWLDFGIRHMYPSDTAMETAIYQLQHRLANVSWWDRSRIYAPSCWDPTNTYKQDVFREVFWVFSGSAFGGCATTLLEFARRTKQKCMCILSTRRTLMWEVNVWYLVYRDCPELFSLFYGNHNAGILQNWLGDML
jgi:hypothetical protein